VTADGVVQNSLAIGNGTTFTLDPSDANGNPTAQSSSLLGSGSLTSGSSFTSLAGSAGILASGTSAASAPTLGLGNIAGSGVSAVPEPSSILLAVLAAIGLAAAARSRKVC
jgi:hypothetical protein